MSDLLLSIHKRLFTGVFHKIKAGRFRDYNILLLIFGFVIISLSSCASTRFQSEETTIQMKGNPTTGYNWFYKISDESIIAIETKDYYITVTENGKITITE